jgi:hypothetical protein
VLPEIDLPLLYRLHDLDEDDGPRAMLAAARAAHHTMPQLVLSLLEHQGYALGTGARDELRRARAMRSDYAGLLRTVEEHVPVRVVKGPTLAKRFPVELVRPIGDLDLVVDGEVAFWTAVRVIAAQRDVQYVDFSTYGQPDIHFVASMAWAGADGLLDRDPRVDLSTAAFPGDFHAVPVRPQLPADPWLAELLGVAEERFQRPFRQKDVLDVLVLGRDVPPVDEVVDGTVRLRLAPEVVELLEYARSCAEIDYARGLVERLRPAAERELAARAARGPAPESRVDADARLALGQPTHGMMLRRTEGGARDVLRWHRYDGGLLALTPVADYLMVAGDVSRETYESAMRALKDADG